MRSIEDLPRFEQEPTKCLKCGELHIEIFATKNTGDKIMTPLKSVEMWLKTTILELEKSPWQFRKEISLLRQLLD